MSDTPSRADLLGLLNTIHENSYGHLYTEVDREQLRYAVYLRKSSDESSSKQTKSIGDQMLDIKEKILDPYKITNFIPIDEEHSAKEPDTRFKFRKMLDDLYAGKLDGIIAWHPDRLARNMKEAGEIIDMLDKFVIKDLLFATATYEDSANGKMMLGITFALSKQYSEHLSESVLRGYKRRIEDGKYLGKMVHGYKIMDEGFLEPDGKNFLILQQAFRMRLQDNPLSLNDVAKWLNKQDYMQCYGREQKRSRTHFTDKKLSDIFRESIYAGYLQYGVNKPVDLTELYGFVPMISHEEYMRLNDFKNLDRIVAKGSVLTKTKLINLLKGKVTCGHCGGNMHSNPGTGKTKKKTYVYFRCSNNDCPYKTDNPNNPKHQRHQIRAHIVTNAAIDCLRDAKFDLDRAYINYVEDAKSAVEDERLNLVSQEHRLRANIHQTKSDLERVKKLVSDPDKADFAKYYEDDLKQYVSALPKYERELAGIKHRQQQLKDSVMSEEKFIKLMETVIDYISKLKDLDQINEILTKFYSNFTIENKSVSVITFNQEWYDVLNPAWLGIRDSNPNKILGDGIMST